MLHTSHYVLGPRSRCTIDRFHCIDNILKYAGNLLQVHWRYIEVCREYIGSMLEVYCKYAGNILQVDWRYIEVCREYILEVYCKYAGSVLEVCRDLMHDLPQVLG